MPDDHLIFDLDGTISDPAVGILRSINHALTSFGHAELPASGISACIGPPIYTTFQTLSQSTSERHILALVEKFRERYSDVGYSENTLYPGVAEALAALDGGGVRLGLCTSKREDFAERILTMFGLRPRFTFVSGGDVGIEKATQLARLLGTGVTGPGSVMIGDRAVDVRAGRANALTSVGVLWGHGSESELLGAQADHILAEPGELLRLAGRVHAGIDPRRH